MALYIAFLRGINVGGQKKIKMAALKASLEKSALQNVTTYIQSGNILFESDRSDKKLLAQRIRAQIESAFGFDVPVLVITAAEIEKILEANPFKEISQKKQLFFTLLHEIPNQEFWTNPKPEDYPDEAFQITEKCVYLNCKNGASKAKLNNNIIEQKLKVTATTRNLNTLKKMVEMAQ